MEIHKKHAAVPRRTPEPTFQGPNESVFRELRNSRNVPDVILDWRLLWDDRNVMKHEEVFTMGMMKGRQNYQLESTSQSSTKPLAEAGHVCFESRPL
jgi:hypothetical protein